MPARSTLLLLFLLLVAVPVGAAAYLGSVGLDRERAMKVSDERDAMNLRADDVRNAVVRQLKALYLAELRRETLPRDNDTRQPLHDYFEIRDGRVRIPWGQPQDVPADVQDLARAGPPAPADSFLFVGDLAVRSRSGGVVGFRVDVSRLNRLFLDPASPRRLVPRADERLEQVRLVPERERLDVPGPHGLPRVLYRYVIPSPVLLPPGYVLEVRMRPAASLSKALDAAETRLAWTLAAVGIVVALGILFAWRAVRAETRLAERKAEFVSAVSHELRTPLTSIRMYADMLDEGWVKDGKTAKEYFALISAESERLARLVNNVLDFSRIEKGKKTFDFRLGDPAPVVRDVAEVLRPYLKEKKLELALDVPDSLPSCRFDQDALTQILVNLIDNAVKHGKNEVRIQAEASDREVVLRVLDRGPGIAAAERAHIFEAFHRGPDAPRGGGSGLGLALVQHYVAAHEGRIEVSDREGGGAVFAVRLPAAGASA